MAGFSIIAIIYNPKATGPGKRLSEELTTKLRGCLPASQKIELFATEGPGHAEELAYEIARSSKRPLVISASGDGGYHEVVNGLLRAQNEGATPTAGLLPAGNANDHYHNVHRENVVGAICEGQERRIDVLKLTATIDSKRRVRYAHSYVGFGLTAKIGHNLAPIKGKKMREILAVTRTVFSDKPTELVLNGTVTRAHSLIISNVKTMAKYFKVSQNSLCDDGVFEVSLFSSRSKLRLAGALLKRMIVGLKRAEQVTSFNLKTVDKTLVQSDGEVLTIDADTAVTIELAPKTLRCIV